MKPNIALEAQTKPKFSESNTNFNLSPILWKRS